MSKDQIELYKDLCARVPYDTYVQITDSNTQRIEKLDLLTLLEFQEDDPPKVYKPFYRKLSDLSNGELIDLAKVGDNGVIASTCDFVIIKNVVIASDWRIQLDVRYIFGQNILHPAEEFNCVRNYDFMNMSPALFDYAMSHHLDIRSFIDRNLAIRVTLDNNPYNHE